jgi:hypothetical protein
VENQFNALKKKNAEKLPFDLSISKKTRFEKKVGKATSFSDKLLWKTKFIFSIRIVKNFC